MVIVELLPASHAYCDTYRDGPPILVLDLGYTEIQLSVPGVRVTLDDLSSVDLVMEALTTFKTALVARLG